MKYKRIVYTSVLLVLTFQLVGARDLPEGIRRILENYDRNAKLERIVGMWNKSSENDRESALPPGEEEGDEGTTPGVPDLTSEISNCILERRRQIMQNLAQGKDIMLHCFKATLVLNMLRYLGESPKSSIKLLNGLVELRRIPGGASKGCEGEQESCEKQRGRGFGAEKKKEYVRLYKKAMQKLITERKRLNANRNQTEEEMAEQLNRIDQNSEAFLTEVMKTLGDEGLEEQEEEKLKREISDPKLLSVLDVFSRNYMLKFKFYPGAAARMMRSHNGGFTFDVEVQDSSEGEPEEDDSSDESSTREIKDGPQPKDYFDDDDDDNGVLKGSKGGYAKKKKKQLKKKTKMLKKMIPYLLLPMLIQMTLLPFVFKKLFFLAMKALLAGKMALILVGFNILRNTCIKNDDEYQKIRVEHYGYRRGEEYGAWINGRSLGEPSLTAALSEEPFRGQGPAGKSV